MSDVIEVAPANHFPISSDMVSSDMVASWCLKGHSPWVIWICHLMPVNHMKHHFKLYPSDMVSSIVTQRIVVHLNRSGNALSHLRG